MPNSAGGQSEPSVSLGRPSIGRRQLSAISERSLQILPPELYKEDSSFRFTQFAFMLSMFSSIVVLGSIGGFLLSSTLSLTTGGCKQKETTIYWVLVAEAAFSIIGLVSVYTFLRRDKQRFSYDTTSNVSFTQSMGSSRSTGTLFEEGSGFATLAQATR